MVEKLASLEAAGLGSPGGGRKNYIHPPGPGPQEPRMKEKPRGIKPRFEVAKTKEGGGRRVHKHNDEEEDKARELLDYLARNYL